MLCLGSHLCGLAKCTSPVRVTLCVLVLGARLHASSATICIVFRLSGSEVEHCTHQATIFEYVSPSSLLCTVCHAVRVACLAFAKQIAVLTCRLCKRKCSGYLCCLCCCCSIIGCKQCVELG